MLLVVADHAFFVAHTLLILFNMVGWAWPRTRVAHLVTLGLTTFSWFVLGAWKGWGYCLCTDWHFRIRHELGYVDPEFSYVQLLARHWFGLHLSLTTANLLASSVYVAILVATIASWTRLALIRRSRVGR